MVYKVLPFSFSSTKLFCTGLLYISYLFSMGNLSRAIIKPRRRYAEKTLSALHRLSEASLLFLTEFYQAHKLSLL